MSALVMLVATAMAAAQNGVPEDKAARYRVCVQTCLDNLVEHGTDRYGPVHTPMWMSIVDVRANASPREPEVLDGLVRSEGRLHRRNPAGCDLWDDQPMLRTAYAFSDLTGDKKYADAADAYIAAFFERARLVNGLLSWGSHVYYDAYTDEPDGDRLGNRCGPHEILVLCANWDRMWAVDPKGVQKEIELIWEWHIVDKKTGQHNRHDDKRPGCDFAFSGGSFLQAFAFLHSKTKDPEHLKWAKTVAGHHWNARNPETNLAPDAPSTGNRYDATHSFTTLPGPHSATLLKAFEATGDPSFKDTALAYIRAYAEHGWDEDAGQYRAMLALDGTPIMSQEKGEGYDVWKPTGYIDVWRSIMYSYEFPMAAAQTAVYAHELTGDAAALESAKNWARTIRASFPPGLGRRWGKETREALPGAEEKGGTYAENYGRAISFFLHLHRATNNPADLRTALDLADEAVGKLYENGWFKGHPAKPYYEATDGVGYLLYALTELVAYPKPLASNL